VPIHVSIFRRCRDKFSAVLFFIGDCLMSNRTAGAVASCACPAGIYYHRRRPEVVGHHVTNDVIVLRTSADLVVTCVQRAASEVPRPVFLRVACGTTLFLSLFPDLGKSEVPESRRMRADSVLLLSENKAPAAAVDDEVSSAYLSPTLLITSLA